MILDHKKNDRQLHFTREIYQKYEVTEELFSSTKMVAIITKLITFVKSFHQLRLKETKLKNTDSSFRYNKYNSIVYLRYISLDFLKFAFDPRISA